MTARPRTPPYAEVFWIGAKGQAEYCTRSGKKWSYGSARTWAVRRDYAATSNREGHGLQPCRTLILALLAARLEVVPFPVLKSPEFSMAFREGNLRLQRLAEFFPFRQASFQSCSRIIQFNTLALGFASTHEGLQRCLAALDVGL